MISGGFAVRKGDQGFSLVESLIAIIILAITLSGGMAFYYNANNLYFRSLHLRQATFVAETKMEEIKRAGCAGTSSETGASVTIGSLSGLRDVTKPGSCAATNNVTVRVHWREPGDTADHEVNLATSVGP